MKLPVEGRIVMGWLRTASLTGLVVALAWTTPASASETITYTYDAKGRLIAVTHSGTVNNGVQATYTYDPADNRTNVTVTGATGSGQGSGGGASVPSTPTYVVVPLNGYTLILIP